MSKQLYNFSVIFDMDGVLVDNAKFHFKAYSIIVQSLGKTITRDYYIKYVNGKKAVENLKELSGGKLSADEIKALAAQKERHYRKLYRKHIKPLRGLLNFLGLLHKNNIKIAMATSAPVVNVNFVLKATKTRRFFDKIVSANHVKKGKPNPEVYLKAAKILKTPPKNCIVFEDALNGIEAGQRAGMKVVGVATTNKAKDLRHADLVVKDFSGMNLEKLAKLFKRS